MKLDARTLARFERMLAAPDEPGLPARGHRLTCAGDPERWRLVYMPLRMAWEVRRYDRGTDAGPGRHASAQPLVRKRLEFRRR